MANSFMPADPPDEGERELSFQEAKPLFEAMKRMQFLDEPGNLQLLVDFLTTSIPGFEFKRSDAGGNLSVRILFLCLQLRSLRALLTALEVVASNPAEVSAFTVALNDLLTPPPQHSFVLTADEIGVLDQCFAAIDMSTVSGVLRTVEPGADVAQTLRDLLDACHQHTDGSHEDAVSELLSFVETCAHSADDTTSSTVHRLLETVFARLGRAEQALMVCRAAADGLTVIVGQSAEYTNPEPDASGEEVKILVTTDPPVTRPPSAAGLGPSILGGVPPQNTNFTGRGNALTRLGQTLADSSRAAVLPTTLHGLGGIGKSQLATEFARQRQVDYDLIWWVPADDSRSIRRSLVSLARRLDLPISADYNDTVQTVLDDLRLRTADTSWLLVFDDAGDPEDVQRFLPESLPAGQGRGHVIITSRRDTWKSASSVLTLDVFTRSESIELLRYRWRDLSEDQADHLAQRLGDLPLALEQAVAVHERSGMPYSSYLEALNTDIASVLGDRSSTSYPRSVAETYLLAFRELQAHSASAAQLLELCSFLGSAPIAGAMLARGRGAPLPSPLAETMRDEMKTYAAVRDIGAYALAILDDTRNFIKVHPLVRAVVRDQMDDERREAMKDAANELLALASPGNPDDQDTWAAHAQIGPHVRAAGIIHSEYAHVRRIVLDQIRYMFVIGDNNESASLAEEAVDSWRSRLGEDDEMTLMAQFHLANALRPLGEYERAREILRDAYQRMQSAFGPDSDYYEYTLRAANSLAAGLRLAGNFSEALKLDELNYAHYLDLFDRRYPATLRVANNLAVDHRLLGDFATARTLDQTTLQDRVHVLGGDSFEILSSAASLARDLYAFGEFTDSLQLLDRYLVRFQIKLPDHPFVLLALRTRAAIQRKLGRYEEAVALAETTLDATRSRFGNRHEHTLSAMVTLANCYLSSEKADRALELTQEALSGYTERLGESHPFTLAVRVNLASIYRGLIPAHVEAAREHDSAALAQLTERLGPTHPYTLCALANLANDEALLGNIQDALVASQEAYDRSVVSRPENHHYTLALAGNLALDLKANGREGALALQDKALSEMKRLMGPKHPATVNMAIGNRLDCDIEILPT